MSILGHLVIHFIIPILPVKIFCNFTQMLIGNENEPIKVCKIGRNETDSASNGDWNTIEPDNDPDAQNVIESYSNPITTNERSIYISFNQSTNTVED